MKRVVLVRTAGPRNAGAAMRAVANFGPAELWFVAPERPSLLIHPEFEQMSHGVENIRERIVVVDTLEEALADVQRSFGFTARARGSRRREDWLEEAMPEALAADAADQKVALVFGSEESGLSAAETDQLQTLCHLATSSEHTSINLATAVAIVLHSVFSSKNVHAGDEVHLTTGEDLAYLREHLKAVLGGEVARGEAARRDIEASIDRVFQRAPIESRDARAWHMMMRALGSTRSPKDFGLGDTPKARRREKALERNARKTQPEGEA